MIDKQELQHIAKLARLELPSGQEDALANQMQQIVEYVSKLKEVDTSQVQPTFHSTAVNNAWREDVSQPPLTSQEVFCNAPQHNNEAFMVPSWLPQSSQQKEEKDS